MLRRTRLDVKYIIETLGRFMKILNQKRPAMADREWWF
jgi:hypothetical protein